MLNSIEHLQHGSERQRQAYQALQDLEVFSVLRNYSPVLAGTIPLDIDTEISDLDIICEAEDLDVFELIVKSVYQRQLGFGLNRKEINSLPALIARFFYASFKVEIFGQPRPVTEQNAYRHMAVEARLLAIGGETSRHAIRSLKRGGVKTEHAFARYFHIQGDPYEALLRLYDLNEGELRRLVMR
jgi:Domain of unknown function (DUF4269)